jgi:hypothetical protein
MATSMVSLPMEWPRLHLRMRAFTDIAEADRYARQFGDDREVLIAHSCMTHDGHIGIRALLPHSACESTAIFGPDVTAQFGGWVEIIAVIESF